MRYSTRAYQADRASTPRHAHPGPPPPAPHPSQRGGAAYPCPLTRTCYISGIANDRSVGNRQRGRPSGGTTWPRSGPESTQARPITTASRSMTAAGRCCRDASPRLGVRRRRERTPPWPGPRPVRPAPPLKEPMPGGSMSASSDARMWASSASSWAADQVAATSPADRSCPQASHGSAWRTASAAA